MDFLALIQSLGDLPLHVLLLGAVIVLWRANRELQGKLDSINESQKLTHAVLVEQAQNLTRLEAKQPTPRKSDT